MKFIKKNLVMNLSKSEDNITNRETILDSLLESCDNLFNRVIDNLKKINQLNKQLYGVLASKEGEIDEQK